MAADDEEKTVRILTDAERYKAIRAAAREFVDRLSGPAPAHPESLRLWHLDRVYVCETIRDALAGPDCGEHELELQRTYEEPEPRRDDEEPERPRDDDDHAQQPYRGLSR